MQTERLGAAGKYEGEQWPARPGEGVQRTVGGLGAVIESQPVGCGGQVGPDCAGVVEHEVGQRSGWLVLSEAAEGGVGKATAVGAGWVLAGCGNGKQKLLELVAGWGVERLKGSPVEEQQKQRVWVLV